MTFCGTSEKYKLFDCLLQTGPSHQSRPSMIFSICASAASSASKAGSSRSTLPSVPLDALGVNAGLVLFAITPPYVQVGFVLVGVALAGLASGAQHASPHSSAFLACEL